MTDPETPPVLEASKDARLWGMLCHLLALSGLIGVPFGHILGPLVMWLIKRQEFPFVDDQGKEALNFGITVTIVLVGCLITFFLIIPILIAIGVGIAAAIFNIIGAIKANEGVAYRYPMTIRLVK